MTADLNTAISLAFFVPLVATMVLETLAPRRALSRSTGRRWLNTAALCLINSWLAQAALVMSVLGAASQASSLGLGLLHLVSMPPLAAGVAGFFLLDFFGYLKHRLFHAWPLLWQFHAVHHSDADMDVATSLRHHPADYLLDGFMTAAFVLAFGISVQAVLAYQVVSLVHNSFRHANFRLPVGLDVLLRKLLVTPDFHRVHHSATARETNSNFGGLLTVWDRLFGTCVAQPQAGHEGMEIGLEYFRSPREDGLFKLLTQPLRQPQARLQALQSQARQSQAMPSASAAQP